MLCSDLVRNKIYKGYNSNEENETYPRGYSSSPVTPKMLIKALKRLNKCSFKRVLFSPREVAYEILRTYPEIEQDYQILLLEVSDKLLCAAAAGLVGTKQDLGYFAFEMGQREAEPRSELMFWIFYRRILYRRARERSPERKNKNSEANKSANAKRKKTVKVVPLTEGRHNHIPPIPQQREVTRKP